LLALSTQKEGRGGSRVSLHTPDRTRTLESSDLCSAADARQRSRHSSDSPRVRLDLGDMMTHSAAWKGSMRKSLESQNIDVPEATGIPPDVA
jgi:hypothetical protein